MDLCAEYKWRFRVYNPNCSMDCNCYDDHDINFTAITDEFKLASERERTYRKELHIDSRPQVYMIMTPNGSEIEVDLDMEVSANKFNDFRKATCQKK